LGWNGLGGICSLGNSWRASFDEWSRGEGKILKVWRRLDKRFFAALRSFGEVQQLKIILDSKLKHISWELQDFHKIFTISITFRIERMKNIQTLGLSLACEKDYFLTSASMIPSNFSPSFKKYSTSSILSTISLHIPIFSTINNAEENSFSIRNYQTP
jgi:hypothetical protein